MVEEHKRLEVVVEVDLRDTPGQFIDVEQVEQVGHLPQQLSVDYL